MKTKPRKFIAVRLPDGVYIKISNRAKARAKETGKRPNISEVVLMALVKFLGL